MKKNKMITILLSSVAALLCVGLAVSAAQIDTDSSALADESSIESESIVVDETSATEPPPCESATDVQKVVHVTEEELKAQASNVADELNTVQDVNSGNAFERKRAKAIAKRQAEAKQDVIAYDVMEKYNSDFKQDTIITEQDKDIECMWSMVELLNKNVVADSERELLIAYVERRINWLSDNIKLKNEFTQALDNVR